MPGADTGSVPPEEIRFAVVLNGGVSLAVWMGGTVLELDRLVASSDVPGRKARPRARTRDDVYAELLRVAGCTARVDVVSGTSAGGINGAALALSQVNSAAKLELLRDIWVDQGRIESLLRQPFRGAPTSLLKGDEFFLPALHDGLAALAEGTDADYRDPAEAPLDLTITTTVLGGNQQVTVDSLGQKLPQTLHAARFRWIRQTSGPERDGPDTDRDPFSSRSIRRTAARLALASRCTASFPVAFEPVFVPVNAPGYAENGGPLTELQRLRPDMLERVDAWGDGTDGTDRSRYVVDGGLLANTPTREALRAIERMTATGPVRRVVLLVHPHAPSPGTRPAARESAAPSVAETVTGLFGALSAQGSRTFVEEIERHNRAAAGRRGTREDILREVTRPGQSPQEGLRRLVESVYPHYRRLRMWRAGRDLTERTMEQLLSVRDPGSKPFDWDFERVRRAAQAAQTGWPGEIPYAPRNPPQLGDLGPDRAWAWGVSAATGVAESANEVLRQALWMLSEEDDKRIYEIVAEARKDVSNLQVSIAARRDPVDDRWIKNPVLRRLTPDRDYWTLRLTYYAWRNRGSATERDVGRAVEAVTDDPDEQSRIKAALRPGDGTGTGDVGRALTEDVYKVLTALAGALTELTATGRKGLPISETLPVWHDVLAPGGVVPGADDLLLTLLRTEIAATTVGDEVRTGSTTLPVELAQLSAQTVNAFTTWTRTGDDKLGGMSVNRFGGFLKSSWRLNDWTWGRVDAATVLSRVVLQPKRVRRRARLSGALAGTTPADAAAAELDRLWPVLFPDEQRATGDDRHALAGRALAELTEAYDVGVAEEDLPSTMPALADLFAWALHLRIVPEELPRLAAAVAVDRVEGANARSRGEVFLAESAGLLRQLDDARGRVPVATAREALRAFDRAGIGREPLRDEGSSDLIIRTATSAAAVAATVLDSGRAGLGPARPVTRAVRGVMLFPYWAVTGLTSKAVLARNLGLLGLAVGAVLLTLSLFGSLPGPLAGPGAAVGAGALLLAFAYGAMRSGTMLHGLVLITPVVPLLAYAMQRWSTDADARQGASTLLVVLALAAGLMLLGSLPAASGSVLGAVDRLAERRLGRAPDASESRAGRSRRRAKALLAATPDVVVPLAVVAGLTAAAWWVATDEEVAGIPALVREHRWWVAAGLVVATAVAAGLAWWLGRQLQLARQERDSWRYLPVADPGGTTAGWAVIYGVVYLTGAYLVVLTGGARVEWLWLRAGLVAAALLGAVLLLVVPWLWPARSLVRARRAELTRARAVPVVLGETFPSAGEFADVLLARNAGYRWWVTIEPLRLNRRGARLHTALSNVHTSRGGHLVARPAAADEEAGTR